jgi:hypothetical protein
MPNRMETIGLMRQLTTCTAVLVAAAMSASAQAVTATSGDPAVIARIQSTTTTIDRDTARYRRTEHALHEYSAEGGALVGFYNGTRLRKLSAYLTGHSGRLTQHLYYSMDQLVFVYSLYEQYETRSLIEHRVYLNGGAPIRRIVTQSAARPTAEVASWDPLPELLGRVKHFAECAAATAPTCIAPRR